MINSAMYSTPFSHYSNTKSGNGTQHQINNSENNRSRSHTEGTIHHLTSSFDAHQDWNDSALPYKQKLYELFSLIEKEMDGLYVENCKLRARLGTHAGGGIITMNEDDNTPLKRDFAVQMNETIQNVNSEMEPKASGIAKKASQTRQQRWKSAFKNPSGKLALKVSSFPESKHKFVQAFKGHTDGVWHVCTSQVGALIHVVATASADQTAKIWNAENCSHPLANYTGHSGSVNSVAIRPESFRNFSSIYNKQLMVLTCSGDRTAHIWKTNLDELLDRRREKGPENDEVVHVHQPVLRLTGHSESVMAGVWLIGGEQVITASSDRTANLFDAESGKVLKVLSGHDQELTSCSAHPSQKLLATASKDYTFRLWDFREAIHSVAVFQGHNDAVTSVVFSTQHHIVSGSDDRTVKVWDLRNMRSPTSAIRLDSAANRIAISTNKNLLAVPLDNRNICVYDLNGSRQARIPRSAGKCHHRSVHACAWLDDHPVNNLISCGFDKQVIGWRVHLPSSAGTKP